MSCWYAVKSAPARHAIDSAGSRSMGCAGMGSDSKERAAEYAGRVAMRLARIQIVRARGLSAIEQRNQFGSTGVVAGMTARARDAAAEHQAAVGVEQERLAGRRRAKPLRFAPAVVAHDGDARQRGGRPPRIRLLPAVRKPVR